MRFRKLLAMGLLCMPVLALAQPAPERPSECWVRRSVLDGRPRMLALHLHRDLYAAYDLASGQLYKVWKDGIEYKGTIWNTAHGPQPTAQGPAYLLNTQPDATSWQVRRGGKTVPVTTQFLGYSWKNNKVTLRTKLILEDKTEILLEETPEYVTDKKGNPGFERRINTRLPDGVTLTTPLSVHGLVSAKALQVVGGTFTPQTTSQAKYANGQSYGTEGVLSIGSLGATIVSAWFEPRALEAAANRP